MPVNSNTRNTGNAPSAPATRSTTETNIPSTQLTVSNTRNDASATRSIVNPCTFLNTYHQVIKTQCPPNYKFTKIRRPKGYIAELNYLNESLKSNTKINKKEAKEEVATLCVESIKSKYSYNFSRVLRILERIGSQKARIEKNIRQIDQTPEVVKWNNIERMRIPPKPMRVLLLEFCQKYGFTLPQFHQKRGPNNDLIYFTCFVGRRSWKPGTGFQKRSDAKDHVATRAFNSLFLEIKTREEEGIKKANEQMKIQRAQLKKKKEKKYIILLHDAAIKKHLPINYEYRSNKTGGIIGRAKIGEKRFCGTPQISKSAAKEDVSRIAYGNLILTGDL